MWTSVESFENYLYNLQAMYVEFVSETVSALSLLDVLVKYDSESTDWFFELHLILVHSGFMKNVGTYSKSKDQLQLYEGFN